MLLICISNNVCDRGAIWRLILLKTIFFVGKSWSLCSRINFSDHPSHGIIRKTWIHKCVDALWKSLSNGRKSSNPNSENGKTFLSVLMVDHSNTYFKYINLKPLEAIKEFAKNGWRCDLLWKSSYRGYRVCSHHTSKTEQKLTFYVRHTKKKYALFIIANYQNKDHGFSFLAQLLFSQFVPVF